MDNEKGVTLLQMVILLVVVLVLALFIVPQLIGYITSSKKSSFISSAKFYIGETRKFLTSNESFPVDTNQSMNVYVSELNLNQDKRESVYGYPWVEENSFILVKNIGTMESPVYSYSIALQDEEGFCIELREESELNKKDVKKGGCHIQGIGIYATNKLRRLVDTNPMEVREDAYGNTRYYGENPNNYVRFNEELWRIVGAFSVDRDERVKLVRSESIGKYSWDSSDITINEGKGVNDWAQADLMKLLNPGYEAELVGGSLYWNRQYGTCFNGLQGVTISCDFSGNGLTAEAKNLIAKSTFYLGKWNSNEISAKEMYALETGIGVQEHIPSAWVGHVGLLLSSDYGYAMGEDSCSQNLQDSSDRCQSSNYLWIGQRDSKTEWLLSSRLDDSSSVFERMYGEGEMVREFSSAATANDVRPVVYLQSNVKIMSGDGTATNPFILGF